MLSLQLSRLFVLYHPLFLFTCVPFSKIMVLKCIVAIRFYASQKPVCVRKPKISIDTNCDIAILSDIGLFFSYLIIPCLIHYNFLNVVLFSFFIVPNQIASATRSRIVYDLRLNENFLRCLFCSTRSLHY